MSILESDRPSITAFRFLTDKTMDNFLAVMQGIVMHQLGVPKIIAVRLQSHSLEII